MASKRSKSLEIISLEEITIGKCSGAQRYNHDRSTRHVCVTDNHTAGTRKVECSSLYGEHCRPSDIYTFGTQSGEAPKLLPCVLLTQSTK